tara:strand:- start:228 stop:446 length:219 start_codon:yes stop_codon:yes gene_type:complete
MNKQGFIFDLLKLENGWILTLFLIFRFGLLKGTNEYGTYGSIHVGIWKLEFTISLAWKDSLAVIIDEVKGYS